MPGERRGRLTEAVAVTKTVSGEDLPASAFAYVPDAAKSSTWKLPLSETADGGPTAKQVGMALAAIGPGGFRGKKVSIPADALPAVKKKIFAAWKKVHPDDATVPAVLKESLAGGRTFDEVRALLQDALTDALCEPDALGWRPTPWIRDLDDSFVAYSWRDDTYKVDYSIADDGVVSFGDPAEVEVRTSYEPLPDDSADDTMSITATEASGRTVEATDRISGRLIEAKGTDDSGGRIFAVQIIEAGDSKNGRRYTESVLRSASSLYEGAKAYDHHRTDAELQTSTIAGLIGHYRNVAVNGAGLQGDLHLLPSATHTAEALDTSLANQSEGLPPLVGISHDVLARYRPVTVGGRRLQEATAIDKVNSADVVADPAAGGRATRMLAGGLGDTTTTTTPQTEENPVTIEELEALLKGATPEQRATVLEGLGMSAEELAKLRLTEAEPTPPVVPKPGERTTEGASYTKDSAMGRTVVRAVLADANIDARMAEGVIEDLGDTFTEADVTAHIATMQRAVERLERSQLAPTVGHLRVTQDEVDKKKLAMDAFFSERYREGYTSFKGMAMDWLGINPYRLDPLGEDVNRIILRECVGPEPWDSSRRRSTESVLSTTFSLALGDSVTRRLIEVYNQPSLQTWQAIVSSKVPLTDFRTQRIDRVGGYGTLPTVGEGGPYQPLTTPGNEEITYALSKRGGTEDWTLETIANDDIRLISRTPYLLGLAAAQTLYRFVWDFLDTNATCSYDSVALFAAGHGSNTATNALSGANVSTGRKVMRKQTAYGDSKDVLSITPKTLVVVSDIEELAFEICTSAVAMPTGAPVGAATNIPNLHQGLSLLTVDYWSSTTKWALVADPAMVPTFEIGFYQGREDPELFQQNDPQTGSVFTNDKVTWKIRHIYSGALLDHRGFYRGNT